MKKCLLCSNLKLHLQSNLPKHYLRDKIYLVKTIEGFQSWRSFCLKKFLHVVWSRVPGAMHHARWMAKAIYSVKIWTFRRQFHLNSWETYREQYPNCNKNVLQKRYKISKQSLTWINCIESTIYLKEKVFEKENVIFHGLLRVKKRNVYLKVAIFHICIIKIVIQFATQTFRKDT